MTSLSITNVLSLVWMFAVVAFVSWLAANFLVLVVTLLARVTNSLHSRRYLCFLAGLPWFLPLLAMGSLVMLSFAKSQGWIHHHCLYHEPHHPHFCLEHLPAMVLNQTHSLPGILATLGVVSILFLRMWKKYQSFKQFHLLYRLVKGDFLRTTIPDKRPIAFTVGIRKPLIVISKGLSRYLGKRQQRIVVEHEVAHIRHHDVLKNTLFECLLSIHLFPNVLRPHWHLSAEIRADDELRKRFDPLEIAEVLVKLKRAGVNAPYPVSITGGILAARIERLLNPGKHAANDSLAMLVLYPIVLAFPVALFANHHHLETMLGWIL